MSKRILEIDLDGFVYRLAYFGEQDVPLACLRALDWLFMKLKADDARLYLSCKTESGFRRKMCQTYKSNRKPVKFADELRSASYAVRNNTYFTAIEHDGLEADDLVSLAATKPDADEHIIVSHDKDLRSVPGLLFSPKARELVYTTEYEADKLFWGQVLSGDSTDGYKGCKRIGTIGAKKLLDGAPHELLGKTVRDAYAAAGHDSEYLLQQAVCARILRHGDYDINTKTFSYKYIYD